MCEAVLSFMNFVAGIAEDFFGLGGDVFGFLHDVLLVGMGSRFELWDKVRHDAHEATVLAAGMPDVLRDHVM